MESGYWNTGIFGVKDIVIKNYWDKGYWNKEIQGYNNCGYKMGILKIK